MADQVEGLKVWRKGIDLVKEIYRLTAKMPKEEIYGLTSQMRRAAVSIPANIAEGKGRFHNKEYIQFLFVARGSAYELSTLIMIARELEFLSEDDTRDLKALVDGILAMLNGLIRALK